MANQAIMVAALEDIGAARVENPRAIIVQDHGDGTRTISKPGVQPVRVRMMEPRYVVPLEVVEVAETERPGKLGGPIKLGGPQ